MFECFQCHLPFLLLHRRSESNHKTASLLFVTQTCRDNDTWLKWQLHAVILLGLRVCNSKLFSVIFTPSSKIQQFLTFHCCLHSHSQTNRLQHFLWICNTTTLSLPKDKLVSLVTLIKTALPEVNVAKEIEIDLWSCKTLLCGCFVRQGHHLCE